MNREEMMMKIRNHWKKYATAQAYFDFSDASDEELSGMVYLIEELEKNEKT